MIEQFLRERDIEFTRAGDDAFAFTLRGDRKLTIPVVLSRATSGVRFESFFMRAPHENAEEVYRLLLGRNARSRFAWFAVDGLGDVYLTGFVPGVGEDTLDALLGELLTTADQMFDACIERGFATYLARDLAWRAKQTGA